MYIKWILGIPQNLNFSFEQDEDSDGIPDYWIGDSTQCSIYEDNDCPHGFKINNTSVTSDNFYGSGEGKLCFKYKFISGTSFYIELHGSYDTTIYREDDEWHFFEEDISGNGDYFFISSLTAHIVIEDLIMIRNENLESFIVNPVYFDDVQEIVEEEIHTINDEKFLIKPILFNYSQGSINPLFEYITREQLDYLKSLMRKKIIIRMHDDRLLPCRVNFIEESYVDGEQGACQHYDVRISLEAI